MCGIAGVVANDPSLRASAAVRPMLDALSHRGPDDEGLDEASGATLGARRLAIIDLAAGHQPMWNEDRSVLAVQNGEIYNFRELRAELESRGHRLRTRNDTEVLPHAWEEWGEDLVAKLHGMFAIAVWDGRAEVLLLARDRFGKKPLVYAVTPDALVFGSEIQALLAHPAVGREIDDAAIDEYLTLGYVPAPRTAFRAIRKLPAGHMLIARPGREPIVGRYWRLRYEPKLSIGAEEACAELRERIEVAVRRRLMSDVPLGAFLSGGLDSSTVVAYMAKHSSRPVQTFSVGFTDSYYDESRYARVLARAVGADHHELVVDASDASVLPMLARHLGEPYADSSIVPTYHIARATRPHVTVALTGDGGDELLGGYGRYRAAAIAQSIPAIGRRALASIGDAIGEGRQVPRSLPRARRFLRGLTLTPGERWVVWNGYFTRELRDLILGERLRTWPRPAEDWLDRSSDVSGAADVSERFMAADIQWYLADDLLVKMDIATMAASLEARSPLLDHELHEFVARLPIRLKISWSRSKLLLRRAMRGIVPDEILDRHRKMGFTAPVGRWLRGPLRDLLGDAMEGARAVREGYVSGAGVRQLVSEHLRGEAERTMQLWALLMLELWLREVATASTAREPAPATLRR